MALDYHGLTSSFTDAGIAVPQATTDIVSNTDRRDVSEMLDLFDAAETPFVERIGWGPEAAATKIEWLTENLGPGYVVVASAVASNATVLVISTVDGISSAEAAKQVQTGTILYNYSSTDGVHALILVTSITGAGSIDIEYLTSAFSTATMSFAVGDKLYVLGALANEGSLPRSGPWRARALSSNGFTILREDVNITGSMKATQFYAIGREDIHQMRMRMLELTRNRQKVALLGGRVDRSSTVASVMNGCFGFLAGQSGSNIDTTTTSLTETAVNDVVASCWEHGAKNLTWFSSLSQARKFTQWDVNRIRMEPRDTRGGGHVTNYMTEAGVEMEVVALKFFPTNIAFVLDTNKIRLRAKTGRKGIMEKLGKRGDFDEWQIISEFSLEMRKYNQGIHGMFTKLS